MNQSLTPQEKKEYLLKKYAKRDLAAVELSPKYALYFNPSIEKTNNWNFVCATNTLEEAKAEILWRKNYEMYGDTELVIDHDHRFKSWKDETKNTDSQGLTYEPTDALMNLNYSVQGNALQVIAANSSEVPEKNGFKGLCHYVGMEITDYKGFYKIVEFYEI